MLSSVVTGDTVEDGGREISVGDRNTKKSRNKVLGRRVPDSGREKDFKLLDGDVTRSTVNGIPAISFSKRDSKHVKTVPTIPPHGRRKWYLTVQPWTLAFDLLWAFPSNAVVWVRLLGFLGFVYKRQFLEKIGGLIGTVIKLDFQKDNGLRGKFERMAVSINLIKPLVSQIMVNGAMQRVEFESLLSVCFSCNCLGHPKKLCPSEGPTKEMVVGFRSTTEDLPKANKVGEMVEPKLAVKGATKIDLSGIHFQKGDFSSTKNHGGFFKDKKNNGAVVVNENTFSVLVQNNMEGLDLLDGVERREVSKPAREGSNKLFGLPIKSPSLDKKALENAGKIMAVGPGLTTQRGGGLANPILVDNLSIGQEDISKSVSSIGHLIFRENQSMIGINSHFSPMFNGPIESIVVINKEILDYRSHSTVIFKENRYFKNVKSTKVGSSNRRGKGILISKGRGFRNKGDTV
ncbi:hypothetical protein Gohar_017163 [Gossypium harknessii]|uniref:DUF4283 domain-containing protein n=1 Tax=Gossypium harknessii TaxID=34285 RepID=A0A7J9G509_9ROSI|nr:hypothetical protein [Gossypium harknessii]